MTALLRLVPSPPASDLSGTLTQKSGVGRGSKVRFEHGVDSALDRSIVAVRADDSCGPAAVVRRVYDRVR